MATLYRQYRPQTFAELYGQDHITTTLKHAVTSNRLAHVYLFHGPRGTGKTTTARILAKRLNCTSATDGEPCNTCAQCHAATNHQHIDLLEIDAASNRGIDDIRALRDGINLAPSMGTYKIYIIDEVHMLTNEAFTALLKTLEEPVAHAIFILATTEFHKVPETTISRCQVFRFKRASAEELRARLRYLLEQEQRTADDDALEFIIARSDGCYRDAESLLGQALHLAADQALTRASLTELLGLPPHEIITQLLVALIQQNAKAAVTLVDEAFARGFDPEQLVQETIRVAREGALAIVKGERAPALTFTQEPSASARLPQIMRTLVQATQDLAFVPQPLIALHLAILTLCTTTTPTTQTTTSVPVMQTSVPATPTPTPVIAVATSTKTSGKKKVPVKVTVETPPDTGSSTIISSLKERWPELINLVKEKNPVASTFLRAMEPVSVNNNLVQIKAKYPLHRNFFQKSENKAPIEDALLQLVSKSLRVNCFLEDLQPKATTVAEQQKQEEELLSAVKEVFGTPQP